MNLYIGNLSYNVKESDLRHVMEEYGTVASVKLSHIVKLEDQKVLRLSKCRMMQKLLKLSNN